MAEGTRREPGRGRAALLALLFLAALPGHAAAEVDSCREWRGEHFEWRAEVVRRYLGGAPQRELDHAVFELLQREAYLTSCEQSVSVARDEMVGWRLVGRVPDEYASAVVESLLERAGFDVGLRFLLVGGPHHLASAPPPRPARRRGPDGAAR